MLRYVLLGWLNYRPMTGYQVKQMVDNASSHFWHAQTSQIYRTLNELTQEGLVGRETAGEDERDERRVYHIMPAGQRALREWLSLPMTELQPTKDALLARLFFSAQIDRDTLLMQLRVQRALHARQLEQFRTEIAQMIELARAGRPDGDRDGLLWEATRRLGELAEETTVRWLDETIVRIEAEF